MDGLDHALDGFCVQGGMVGRSLLDPPWGIRVESEGRSWTLAAPLRGRGWVRCAGAGPVPLPEGSVALATGGSELVVGSAPDAPVGVVVAGAETCWEASTGADLSTHERVGARAWGRRGAGADVLVGSYSVDGARFGLVDELLPDLVVVPGASDVAALLAVAAVETEVARPGQQVVVDRFLELLAIATVRAWLRTSGAEVPSWCAALDDAVVGPALAAMHAEPGRTWTVAGLAGVAAVSRASFAARFHEAVGEPPMRHLTRWRMALADDLLRDPGRSISSVATAVGYADASAFSTAFARTRGRPPSAARAGAR